jgi:phosphoribosylformylglycinamidine synthase
VFRDILGTGQGANIILSTDMFCLAPPDLPASELPPGCLPPDYLLRHVVRGVRDYGNRMGVPTANGSFHFHPDFRAKPSVIVGAYGIIPEARAKKGVPECGDVIVVIGGRTGRDGIHGATFSSAEMTDRTISVNAAAVQIGNAIEEKRLADALIACRDKDLIRAVTDCGAGGFSSAIGEMGSRTGVRIDLEKAPLKYTGLAPWEIWVSESQERMVLAVRPEHVSRVIAICGHHNVEATVLGEFTDDHRLTVHANGETVCDLTMEFLHHGLPTRHLIATKPLSNLNNPSYRVMDLAERFRNALSHWNACSKEPVVRQYDHGVQGTNVLPPYGGVCGRGPNDAVVLTPILGKPYGLIVAHGLHPEFMRMDPFQGTKWAIAEALSNLVAVGGDVREAALIDNFIWPKPEAEELWSLDAAVDACVHAAQIFGIPFVSGKDSLSGTYRGSDGTVIKIPPVLCISAFGRIPDVTKTVTSDFKAPGSKIVLLGQSHEGVYPGEVPKIDLPLLLKIFERLHKLIRDGEILACHDVSDGGYAVAVAEMCFGSCYGAELGYERDAPFRYPDAFRELAGCFVIEVPFRTKPGLLFDGLPWELIGRTTTYPILDVHALGGTYFRRPVSEFLEAWQQPMKAVFP